MTARTAPDDRVMADGRRAVKFYGAATAVTARKSASPAFAGRITWLYAEFRSKNVKAGVVRPPARFAHAQAPGRSWAAAAIQAPASHRIYGQDSVFR
jgi:hypothetical protein